MQQLASAREPDGLSSLMKITPSPKQVAQATKHFPNVDAGSGRVLSKRSFLLKPSLQSSYVKRSRKDYYASISPNLKSPNVQLGRQPFDSAHYANPVEEFENQLQHLGVFGKMK